MTDYIIAGVLILGFFPAYVVTHIMTKSHAVAVVFGLTSWLGFIVMFAGYCSDDDENPGGQ